MAKVYECKMTKTITVNIKADSEEEAQAWIQTHDFSDVEKLTSMYDVDYDDYVMEETNAKHAIDISE